MNRAKNITDGALLTAIYIVLLLIAIFVPFTFLFGLFILPIPFIIYTARHGARAALLMMFAALGISLIFATVISLPITFMVGIGGIAIGHAIHKKSAAYETWARGTVGFIVGIISVMLFIQFLLNINIYQEIELMIEESINMTKSLFNQFGFGPENMKQLEPFEEQMRSFPDFLPASIAITSTFLAFMSQWLSYKIMNRIESRQLFFPPFRQFNLPMSVIWIYFLALILVMFQTDTGSSLYLASINVMALTVTLIIIQGYSFIFFYADHKKMHQVIPIAIVIASLIFPFIFMFVIRIIGIIDLGFQLKAKVAHANKK